MGAGIGGLTAALSLHAAGFDCQVFETARSIRELGEALAATGIPTAELSYHDRFGNRIWSELRGCAAARRDISGRSTPSTAVSCSSSCFAPWRSGSDPRRFAWGSTSSGSSSASSACGWSFGIATPDFGPAPRRTCSSARMAFTPECAPSFTRGKADRYGMVFVCGGECARPRRF